MEDKPKRTRRTKAQMIAFRAERQIVDLKPEEREPIDEVGVEVEKPLELKFDSEEGISSDSVAVSKEMDGLSPDGYVVGWVTINRAPPTRYAKEWLYCGGDIHETEEKARKVTAPNKIGVAQIKFKVR